MSRIWFSCSVGVLQLSSTRPNQFPMLIQFDSEFDYNVPEIMLSRLSGNTSFLERCEVVKK